MGVQDRRIAILVVLVLVSASGVLADETGPEESSGGWLGVYLVDEVDGGVRIVAVVPGGPAFRAGLRSGDLMIEAGEIQLADQDTLARVLSERRPGRELGIAVFRDGEAQTFRVRPTARPRAELFPVPEPPRAPVAPVARPVATRLAGLQTVALTKELREHYGAPADRGVLVVRSGSDASLGIEVGDVLMRVGGEAVTTPAEVRLALVRRDRSEPLRLELIRGRSPRTVEVPAVKTPAAPRPALAVGLSNESRARQLERSIALLETQLEALRRQLDAINETPETRVPRPDPPANPDR